ncbi:MULTISPECIES: peptidylprolyl isomerase [unclassified Streptococcus]|uniref:peptidylprolyl isomerase n=1 Tax=unclassified Streptococcus TaxID=2608887 RepID=UPI0018A9F1B5|nr:MULTISPECIES: peptidylprolyl isomerase [unclassified Streptococcus]MBF8969375.1 peptidyl-prolyl cis-trans isomerase [Streptococcus sp. NLN76]MBG9366784.1 peptidyl-prolyl cis-trans isomerase [Streptococcus sp. NLN64]
MKKIKIGVVTLLSVVALAACARETDNNTDVITMRGNTITVAEYYDKVKNDTQAQQVLLTMTINEILDEKYGDKVTDEEVTEEYNKSLQAYGDRFQQVLAQEGMTPDTYREQIRTNKLVEYAVNEAAKSELTDENYQAAYEKYTPEVTAQVIRMTDENKAKEVAEKAKNGDDFAQLAKDNSNDEETKDKGGEMKFDSASTALPNEVKTAAFALDNNGVSDVIKVTNNSTLTTSYYVIKVTNKTQKKDNWKDYQKQLESIILAEKRSDRAFIQSVVGKEMEEANIKVKDPAFQNAFSQYMNATGEAAASSSSEDK